eukprot:47249-Chlamydomonas_euryale.AAC.1
MAGWSCCRDEAALECLFLLVVERVVGQPGSGGSQRLARRIVRGMLDDRVAGRLGRESVHRPAWMPDRLWGCVAGRLGREGAHRPAGRARLAVWLGASSCPPPHTVSLSARLRTLHALPHPLPPPLPVSCPTPCTAQGTSALGSSTWCSTCRSQRVSPHTHPPPTLPPSHLAQLQAHPRQARPL